MNRNRQEKGITLIALVVTIIILLILAGIAIYLFTKDGLIEHAKFGKFSTQFRQIEEKVEFYSANKLIEDIQSTGELKEGIELLPVSERLTLEEKNKLKKEKPELYIKITELSKKKATSANLYWIDQEKIETKQSKRYIIDIDTKQIYQYDGEIIYGLVYHTLDGGVDSSNINLTIPNIDIMVDPEDKITSQIAIVIQYEDSSVKQYKIGEKTTTWSTYTGEITLTSKTVIDNNLKNEDNTVTIYAKGKDAEGKDQIESYRIANLDLDMPKAPTIQSNYDYPILTQEGVKLDGEITIIYDIRDDIDNYYSLDNGTTWTKYDKTFKVEGSVTVIAKSVKKVSGLEVTTSKAVAIASNALGTAAYDGNSSTSVNYSTKDGGNVKRYIYIDENMYGKKIALSMSTVQSKRISNAKKYNRPNIP